MARRCGKPACSLFRQLIQEVRWLAACTGGSAGGQWMVLDLKRAPSGQTIVKPTALGPVANTDTKLLIYGLFQKGRVLAQDGDAPRPRRRKPGRQRKYSNHAIETAVTLGMVFHLSSRQSEGLLRSLFALMKLDNDVPDHTTISRRKAKLGKVQRSIATRLSWAQRCEREGWRHRELRQGSGARFSTP